MIIAEDDGIEMCKESITLIKSCIDTYNPLTKSE